MFTSKYSLKKRSVWVAALSTVLLLTLPSLRAENKPEHLEWLKDAGLGFFIHWNVDSQIGTVISHSLVGASDDYAGHYFNELPNTNGVAAKREEHGYGQWRDPPAT